MNNGSIWWTVGCIYGALAITAGAFGGHGLNNLTKDPKKIDNWKTASYYQMFSSVALLCVPFAKNHRVAGPLILGGSILFSGSLYTMVLTDYRKLGILTPIGGLGMIGGWCAMAIPKAAAFAKMI
eukprot:gene2915-3349_t